MQTVLFQGRWMLALVVVLAASFVVRAESVVEQKSTPEAVAAEAMAALKENRIADFAGLMHPEALAQLKRTMLSIVDAAEEHDEADEILSLFKDVESVEVLRELDDAAFFAAFLDGMMQMQPLIGEMLRDMTVDIIGNVAEGTDVVHVVYRGTIMYGDQKIAKLSVMSLQSHGQSWGMLLSGDIEAMTAMLKQRFHDHE